ncbi:hypothetical protein P7C70_g1743, partial [Phenoliferia sp. Uapishka_3]
MAVTYRHPDTSSDAPSSPTTSSFYSRPNPSHRAHKPSSSSRRRPSSAAASSSPQKSSLRTRTLENARLARASTQKSRDLGSDGLTGFESAGPDRWEHGAPNKDGDWESYSEEEEMILARRVERDARRWMEQVRDLADDDDMVEEDEKYDDDEEPPSDFDGVDIESTGRTTSHLPFPAVDPPPSSDQLGDINMDGGTPASPFPSATQPALASVVAISFEETLYKSPCPSCRAPQSLVVDSQQFSCRQCPWSVEKNTVRAVEDEWITHALVFISLPRLTPSTLKLDDVYWHAHSL